MSSTTTQNAIECIIPILSVKDISDSIDYYVKVLGFKNEGLMAQTHLHFQAYHVTAFPSTYARMPKANAGHGSGSALRMLMHSLRSIRRGALRSDTNRQTIPGHMK